MVGSAYNSSFNLVRFESLFKLFALFCLTSKSKTALPHKNQILTTLHNYQLRIKNNKKVYYQGIYRTSIIDFLKLIYKIVTKHGDLLILILQQ